MRSLQLLSFLFICLVVFALSACDDNAPAPVPEANFTISNGGCTGPCQVTFTNTSTNAATYSWNFGDDTPESTEVSPAHTFNTPGTFTVTLTATGKGGVKSHSATVTIADAPYFMRFKANGSWVNLSAFTATRQLSPVPRTLALNGTGAMNGNPKFKLEVEETSIGWAPGLNVDYHSGTTARVLQYTDAAGQVYSSLHLTTGVAHSFFSAITYSANGEIAGTFSGPLRSATGATVQITDGTFKLKFSN